MQGFYPWTTLTHLPAAPAGPQLLPGGVEMHSQLMIFPGTLGTIRPAVWLK